MILLSRTDVQRLLTPDICAQLVTRAMIALAEDRTRQPLREIIEINDSLSFSIMPGVIDGVAYGAKLISVHHGDTTASQSSHVGAIVLFDEKTGQVAAIVDGGEVTGLRTAAASAVATSVLARSDSKCLAILGTGEQAWRHAQAIPRVRPIESINIWGRTKDRAEALALRIRSELRLDARHVPSIAQAVREADIICTTTASREPILDGSIVREGVHINAVGSSTAAFSEIAPDLVAKARFVPDYKPGILAQGGEFRRAKCHGLVDDDHVLDGIGHILAGSSAGRLSETDVTIYKSIGHVVQDIACAHWVAKRAVLERSAAESQF